MSRKRHSRNSYAKLYLKPSLPFWVQIHSQNNFSVSEKRFQFVASRDFSSWRSRILGCNFGILVRFNEKSSGSSSNKSGKDRDFLNNQTPNFKMLRSRVSEILQKTSKKHASSLIWTRKFTYCPERPSERK